MPGWFLELITSKFRLVLPGGLYFLIIWSSMLYAYRRNEELPNDSPDKRVYNKYGILIAPFTLPLVAVLGITAFVFYFILCSILFGIFLVIFPFVMLFFRNLGLIEWLLAKFEKMGRFLLMVNTFLLRLAGFSPPLAA